MSEHYVDAKYVLERQRAGPSNVSERWPNGRGRPNNIDRGIKPTKQIAVNFPLDMQHQLHTLAQRECIPISQIVRQATRDYLAQRLGPVPMTADTGVGS